ncbi:MAG: hypothetical protein ACLPQ6_10815 [Steroidobacteraceae bacterium]
MFRKLALLGAAAVALTAANGPSYAVALPVTQVIWVSGSTALDNAFKHFMILNGTSPCKAGTIDTYEDNNKSAIYSKSNLYTIVACTLNVTIGGFTSGTNAAFVKESSGGSVEGTTFVSNATALNYLDPTATGGLAGCAAGVAGTTYNAGDDLAFTDHTACTGPVNRYVPNVGLADENPEVYTIGPNAASNAIIANLTTNEMFQNEFGVGVSLNLYRALQAQQGLANTVACPTNSDLLSCMPSLTATTVRTLMSNALGSGSWASLLDPATGKAINSGGPFNGVATVAAANQVYLCRRGDDSGTQAATDIYFYNNRCQVTDTENPNNPAGDQFAQATTTLANCAGLPVYDNSPEDAGCTWQAINVNDTVFAGSGTGDVAKCLDAHDSNGTFAIGVVATNNAFGHAGGASGVGDYRMVALDGAHPTVQSTANGTYRFAMDNVANVANNGTATAKAFQSYLVTEFTTKPAVLGDLITAQVGDANYGVGGLFDQVQPGAGAQPAMPAGLAAVEAKPTSATTQYVNGAAPNNDCIPPVPNANLILNQVSEDAP